MSHVPAARRWRPAVLLAAAAVACAVSVTTPLPAQPRPRAGADTAAAVRWNVIARRLWAEANARRGAAGALSAAADSASALRFARLTVPQRLLTVLAVAQYDAAAGAPPGGAAGAVADASAAVLRTLLPDSATQVDVARALAQERGPVRLAAHASTESAPGLPGGPGAPAARFLAWADGDRHDARWTGVVPTGPGMWSSAAGQPPGGAALTLRRPWTLDSASQFRPAPPPAYGAPAFDSALAEVGRVARTRTAEQARIARLWAATVPPVYWNAAAADALVRARPSEVEAARVLALVNVAMADATVACWDAKYHYWLLRPSQADSAVTLAEGVPLPNFPSYPSGHACSSGAAAEALGALVPAARAASDRAAAEAAESRLYAGVHYRFDNDTGLALGRRVARHVLAADARGRFGAGAAWGATRAASPAAGPTPGGHAAHGPAAPNGTDSARLGAVHFPTSAAPAAHAEFERGVLYLHNFHYPQARAAFARARSLDPGDAMSAAFEALAWTGPVWNIQDTAQARAALRAFAPTRAARLARARTPRERRWVDAVEALYGTAQPGDTPKPVRDTAFSRALGALHASDPAEPEAASFYALSLLGLNQGDREPVAYAHAEAVADTVLRAYPRHPGALHYKIHAVDDPANARRGLAAARTYGEVAPDAGHALHMTSHIYIALGMWDDVVRANRMAAATSPHVFGHGTYWLAYGLVQQGRVREARAWVDSMLTYDREVAAGAVAVRGRADPDVHAVLMAAAHVADAEAWDTPLASWRPDTTHLRSVADLAAADFLAGYAAARRAGRPVDVLPGSRARDRLTADSALARLTARDAAEAARGAAGPEATALGEVLVMEQMLRAELLAGAGRADSAVALLRAAQARLEALPFAFGPPPTVKIPAERAGELLLFANRPAEALAEFDRVERLAPGRTQTALRRARALALLGRRGEAARAYAALDSAWRGAEASFPNRTEARVGGGAFAAALAGGPVAVDTVGYASGDLRLRGVVYRPTDGGRHPAVVALHGSGGCWRASEYELLGRLFAARGYVAFLPCRRGLGLSAGQGEAVMDQLRREGVLERDSSYAARSTELLATTQLADVRAAIAAVRARPDVDPARVAVTGVSYGGILTLLAAEADSTLRAAVAFAPAAMNWARNAPLRERMTAGARRTRVPTLVLQAENDWNVGPATAIPAAVRAGGGDAVGHLYPAVGENANEGHGLMVTEPDWWGAEVFAFLDRHLGAPAAGARPQRGRPARRRARVRRYATTATPRSSRAERGTYQPR